VAASPHHRDEEDYDENQNDGSYSDVHEFAPPSSGCAFPNPERTCHAAPTI